MRRFTDSTVQGGVVDNSLWMYLVELVDCGLPEPYAVQIQYTS